MSRNLHITVAALCARDGRFLLVEERIDNALRINQPAGHLEAGENLLQAVIRETREETAYDFTPEALVGLYQWQTPDGEHSYLRAAFCGSVGIEHPERALDSGIERALWLPRAEIMERQAHWRSPLVLRCIDDYLAGRRYPLDILVDLLPA